jgi:tetratricopeptide (TPR) repeat protein
MRRFGGVDAPWAIRERAVTTSEPESSPAEGQDAMPGAGDDAVPGSDPGPGAGPPAESGPIGLEPEDGIIIAATAKALELEPIFFFYHDFLARLYWERGLAEEAAEEVRVSFSLMPLFTPHTLLDDDELLQELAGPILEGVRQARSTPGMERVVIARGQAEVEERLGRNEEAMAAWDHFLQVAGPGVEAECRYAQARLHHRENLYDESIPLLERVVQLDEDGNWGIGALRLLGLAHGKLGDHESAIDALRRYRAKRPGTLAPLILLADGLKNAGNSEEAGRLYLVAVRRFPEAPQAYLRLIAHLEQDQQYDEALRYARRLRERLPHDEAVEALVQRLRARAD